MAILHIVSKPVSIHKWQILVSGKARAIFHPQA
jgi:hypothetical protein